MPIGICWIVGGRGESRSVFRNSWLVGHMCDMIPEKGVHEGTPRQWGIPLRYTQIWRQRMSWGGETEEARTERRLHNWLQWWWWGIRNDSLDKLKAVLINQSLNSRNDTFLFLCSPRVWIYLVVLYTWYLLSAHSVQRTVVTATAEITKSVMRPLLSDTIQSGCYGKASNNNIDHVKIGYMLLSSPWISLRI